jgi:two-component system chemotaxis response regulator CheY
MSSSASLRILVVDDSRLVHRFLDEVLANTAVTSVHALNGREALAHATEPFDAILLDWEMPELSGPDVLRALAQVPGHAPVIMMTSRNRPEEIREMLSLGAVEYVMKPFTREILLEKLASVA